MVVSFNILWTLLFAGAYCWIVQEEKTEVLRLAEREAKASHDKDEMYRKWVARQGGIYVRINEEYPPNPYLSHIFERDVTTPGGQRLTLVNPAYMTRQVHELAGKEYGVKGHITSLNPIRPENRPDDWERGALMEFEKGRESITAVSEINGEPYLRYIERFVVAESCLNCHAAQGYTVGDVRGGIATSVPLSQYYAISSAHITHYALALALIWLAGIALFNFGGFVLRRHIKNKEQVEAALKESENRWKTIVRSEPECVKILDTDGCVLDMNPAGLVMFEAAIDQINGQRIDDLVVPEHKDRFNDMLSAVFSGETVRVEFDVVSFGGKRLTLETTGAPLFESDDPGKVTALLAVTRDITERKKYEEQLQLQRKILNRSQEVAKLGSWHLDIVNNVLTWSDQEYRIFGRTPDEFDATYEAFLDAVHPDDREMVNRAYTHAIENHLPYECTHRVLRPDGEVRVVLEKSEDIVDENGKTSHSYGFTQDITGQYKAEQARKTLELQLRQAQKMEAIGTLAGGIAHDFNNILSIIINANELVMEETPEESKTRQFNAMALKAANRAKDLVRQILAFSRQTTQELVPLKPHVLIKEDLKLVRSTIPATVTIREEIDPSVGHINGDPTQIHQLLINLCTNAVQAMDEKGTLTISLRETTLVAEDVAYKPGLQPGQYARLTVGDTGCGMTPEILERIFVPFFTTKKVAEGTGMGLAVTHGIVEGHGGMIRVESEPGRGTTFDVYFPVIQSEVLQQQDATGQIPTGNERILFVDDEKMIARMGGEMLRRMGYRVTVRDSCNGALETFKTTPGEFDLVITDQTMPLMSGVELAAEILKIRPDLPIILCTGFSKKISKEEAQKVGIREFLFKPIGKSQLAHAVRKALDKNRKTEDR